VHTRQATCCYTTAAVACDALGLVLETGMGDGSLSPGKLERAQRAIRFLSSLPIVDNSQDGEFYLNQLRF